MTPLLDSAAPLELLAAPVLPSMLGGGAGSPQPHVQIKANTITNVAPPPRMHRAGYQVEHRIG
ncbi:MAG: hypothetical protein H6712_00560 [Myxococcales bacterium]|nr:hypothetical protein [Myxococcales bacterium]MCB9712316.1 hypothetical protein [Myxococcales bacterium]